MATQLNAHARNIECSEEEWQARQELAACYRIFDHLGWAESIYNHISVRVPGEDNAFLINPFGLNYNEVTARNLVRIGLDGTPAEPTSHPVNRAGLSRPTITRSADSPSKAGSAIPPASGRPLKCPSRS